MKAYYNEHAPYAAQWLKNLIDEGLIPSGDVDERSIEEVQPDDLDGYDECHFFAGIGGWSLALQLAGWRGPVWTGPCPCPPFSSAGKAKACPSCGGSAIPCPRRTGYFVCIECLHAWYADGRHLWPEFRRLIAGAKRRPPAIFGEQVAGRDGLIWLAGVRATLEELGCSVGAADLCAACVCAPHIRQRLFWVADAGGAGCEGQQRESESRGATGGWSPEIDLVRGRGLGDTDGAGSQRYRRPVWINGAEGREAEERCACEAGGDGGLGDTTGVRPCRGCEDTSGQPAEMLGPRYPRAHPWSDYSIVICREPRGDGYVEVPRRVEPGTFPLVDGVPGRVGRLRAYGNAIVPQVAAEFVKAYMER